MSFFQFMPWIKTIRHLTGIIILLAIGFFIYGKFVKKDTQNTTFSGNVEEVNIIQNTKRKFIPFVEALVGQESGDSDFYAGIRTGLRFEF